MLTVNITIGHEELRLLQERQCSLCFAQPVEVDGVEYPGNVVLHSIPAEQLSTHISFSWEELYMVFGQLHHTYHTPVCCDTTPASITHGQLLIITPSGSSSVRGQPSPLPPQGSQAASSSVPIHTRSPFYIVNDWNDLSRAGVHVLCAISSARGGPLKEIYMPSFISPSIPLHTIVKLRPSGRKISMFVDTMRRLGPGFSFDPEMMGACTIELKGRNVAHVAFRN